MNKIKLFVMAAALVTCTTASAQFSNTGTRNNQRTSRTAMGGGLDGNGPEAGYKGFAELGYTIKVGDYGSGRLAFSTTHGYQFNEYLFVGAGAGVSYFTESEDCGIPIFADVRVNFLNNSISPFSDVKIGYAVSSVEGFYFNPSVGCRFGFVNNLALSVSFGYELHMFDYYLWYCSWHVDHYDTYKSLEGKRNCGGLTMKVGFEF